ncbi:MAG: hypothetical protein NVS3B20_18790 [Polyangiales bacterium]
MKHPNSYLVSVLTMMSFTCLGACASSNSANPASIDNYAGCTSYVNKVNGLPCASTVKLNADSTCAGFKQVTTCSLSKYFDCVAGAYQCKDIGGTSVIDASGLPACGGPPACQ